MTPEGWVDVGASAELALRPVQEVRVGTKRIALTHRDGEFGAISGNCNHVGGPLGRGTLEAVISARNKAVSATGVKDTARAEGELTQALGRLFALTEAYPELKTNQNVLQLQEELASTENKVGFSRQFYNDVATQYNTRQATFPTLLVAGLAKASSAELWEIEDAGERAVPKVDL